MEQKKLEEQITLMVQPLLEESDMFITSIRIKPTNNIKVFLDADSGLNIAKCATINRKLYHAIEEDGMFPEGDFSLEVSSPGVDEPLLLHRQYLKNVGRTVEVINLENEALVGVLLSVEAAQLTIHLKGTKKEAPKDVSILFSNIKSTIVQVVF